MVIKTDILQILSSLYSTLELAIY